MIRVIACVCLVVCLTGSALVRSQENTPDFTGRWVLNPSLTRPKVPPGFENKNRIVCCETKSLVVVIDNNGTNLTIITNGVEVNNQGKEEAFQVKTLLTINGETTVHTDGKIYRTTAHWESGKLIVRTESDDKSFIPSVEARSLSKDGKTMTIEFYDLKMEGEPALTQVFERSDK